MRRKGERYMKKFILSLICIIITSMTAVLPGCNMSKAKDYIDGIKAKDYIDGIDVLISDDNYRNVYQIWVGSFCDSNDDKIGDIQGIISKLDYLNDGDPNTDTDLGVDAIWLSPIMPSPSYHKYNVTDYYNIDPEFGTLKDFDSLIKECKKRGVKVIIDLILNHISSEHPWFKKACEEVKQGNFEGYAKYFEIVKSVKSPGEGYREISGAEGIWYEGNFTYEMPEWNLNEAKTREEFIKISKFWMDRGAGGFRLDAIKYFTNNNTDGIKFLKWYCDACREINNDIYIVGENWDDNSAIYDVYRSGIDSQFAFRFSGSADSSFAFAANVGTAARSVFNKIKSYCDSVKTNNPNAIDAWFLENHDIPRISNYLKDIQKAKMAAAMYMLVPGNAFIYYGQELGITAADVKDDISFRTPMIWDSDHLPEIHHPPGLPVTVPKRGGVKQQEEDQYSLLNFYKRIIKIKMQNPGIARGEITETVDFDDVAVGAYYIDHDDERLLIIHNTSLTEGKTLTIAEDILKDPVIRADLVASNPEKDSKDNLVLPQITLEDNILYLPKQSSVILKTG